MLYYSQNEDPTQNKNSIGQFFGPYIRFSLLFWGYGRAFQSRQPGTLLTGVLGLGKLKVRI